MTINFAQAFLHWIGCVGTALFFCIGALLIVLVLDALVMVVKDLWRRLRK